MHRSLVLFCTLLASLSTSLASPTFRRVVAPDENVDNVDTFASVSRALSTAPALQPGAVIQIEPGALPSTVGATEFNNAAMVAGVTIRGNLEYGAADIAPINFNGTLVVAATTVRLENLNIQFLPDASLTINGLNFTLLSSIVRYPVANDVAIRLSTSGALISANRFESNSSMGGLIRIGGATNTTIQDNEFSSTSTHQQILYDTAGTKNDVVQRNTFRANRGNASTVQVALVGGVNNVTFRENLFADSDFTFGAIDVALGCQNIVIESNRFVYPAGDTLGLVRITGGSPGLTTSFKIAGNDFQLGSGACLLIGSVSSATFSGVVEGNRFAGGAGIRFNSSVNSSLSNVDLGGGTQGSLGGNDFRAFTAAATNSTGAIVVVGGGPALTAQRNAFTGNPELVVFDQADDAALIDVNTQNALSGNEAYVAALYSKFLRRAADLANADGAGAVAASLENGASRARVAGNAVRSSEALDLLVSDLYRLILKRGPTIDERESALRALRKKSGKEEAFAAKLYASPDGFKVYGSNRAFVAAVYNTFLRRSPSDDELAKYARFATKNRSAVVRAVLGTAEFKAARTNEAFQQLLRREPSENELKKFAKQDRIRLLASLAATDEFFGAAE